MPAWSLISDFPRKAIKAKCDMLLGLGLHIVSCSPGVGSPISNGYIGHVLHPTGVCKKKTLAVVK